MTEGKLWPMVLAGGCAGAVAGFFGGGGGMVLVPILTMLGGQEDEAVFPASLSVMLPVCLTCIAMQALSASLPWKEALPYLLGSAGGGVLAGVWGRKIPVVWLHRGLGLLILWGGFRYLWH